MTHLECEILSDDALLFKKRWHLKNENGSEISHASGNFRKTAFRGQWIDSVLIGGVGTEPQYRNLGYMRQVIEPILEEAVARGAILSFLHPFSFACYRKFGYERVSDTIICDFPITALNFVSRYPHLQPYTDAMLPELLSVYHRVAIKRNLSYQRNAIAHFLNGPNRKLFLDFLPDGTCDGYVILEEQYHYDGINRNISDNLHVWELVFDTPDALKRLLGFLRQYEGQLETVRIHDIGMAPEINWNLRHYMHTKYEIRPDISAKVLQTEKLLQRMPYPDEEGEFTLKIEDTFPSTAGTWNVHFSQGQAEIKKLPNSADADLILNSEVFAQLAFGIDTFTPETLSWLPGVNITGNVKDFLKVFTKCRNGLYEHF